MLIEKLLELKTECECGCGGTPSFGKRFIHGHHAKGAGNGRWKGGTRIIKGYIQQHCPNHPRAVLGYVPQHVLIAEAVFGRPLPRGVVVHHVDGNRKNNITSNLVICQDAAYHCLLHKRERALKGGGDVNAGYCRFCMKWELGMNKDCRGHHYHKACLSEYDRRKYDRRKATRTCGNQN